MQVTFSAYINTAAVDTLALGITIRAKKNNATFSDTSVTIVRNGARYLVSFSFFTAYTANDQIEITMENVTDNTTVACNKPTLICFAKDAV